MFDNYVEIIFQKINFPAFQSLMFLKWYDGWTNPVEFNLRWTVFTYFWQHKDRINICKYSGFPNNENLI